MSSSACLHFDHSGTVQLGTDRAFSPEGTALTAMVSDTLESLWTTETVGAPLRARRLALAEAAQECGESDWDGYGAAPANPLSVNWAGRVLEALPSDSPSPEVAFDPSGEVVLEWSPSTGRMLSVSVSEGGELRFALRTPSKKLTGIETFSDELPDGLAQAFSALVG